MQNFRNLPILCQKLLRIWIFFLFRYLCFIRHFNTDGCDKHFVSFRMQVKSSYIFKSDLIAKLVVSRCAFCKLRRNLVFSVPSIILADLLEKTYLLVIGAFRSTFSPGILSRKVGQPATNCKGRFFNCFWSRNMSSITYQKSPKIRVGEVDEKRVF